MKRILSLALAGMFVLGSVMTVSANEYVVKKGDVLWKIARDNGTTVDALVELNGIKNRNLIYVNQVVKLPEAGIKKEAQDEVMTLTNAEKAVAVIESLGTDNAEPVAFINPDKYIQHNLAVGDGLAGFGELVSILPKETSAKNIRVFEDGDFVFMHNEYDFFGPKVGFDIFRFEDGKIVEHWDNLAAIAETPNPSGRGQLDGTTVLKDVEKTEENKALVKNMINDVLMGAAPEKITDYISTETYLQHNTAVADGLDGLGAAIAALKEAGTPMIYTENHFVLGQGNFVLGVSEGEFLGEHVAFYDLFRVEDGKIVEHWDVIESIPAKEEWKNDNGKF